VTDSLAYINTGNRFTLFLDLVLDGSRDQVEGDASICSDAISGVSVSPGITLSGASASLRISRLGLSAIPVSFVNNPDTGPDHPIAKTEKSRLGFKRRDLFAGYLKGRRVRTRIFNLPVQHLSQPLLCYLVIGRWLQGNSVSRQGPLLCVLCSSRSHLVFECVIVPDGFRFPALGKFNNPDPWN